MAFERAHSIMNRKTASRRRSNRVIGDGGLVVFLASPDLGYRRQRLGGGLIFLGTRLDFSAIDKFDLTELEQLVVF